MHANSVPCRLHLTNCPTPEKLLEPRRRSQVTLLSLEPSTPERTTPFPSKHCLSTRIIYFALALILSQYVFLISPGPPARRKQTSEVISAPFSDAPASAEAGAGGLGRRRQRGRLSRPAPPSRWIFFFFGGGGTSQMLEQRNFNSASVFRSHRSPSCLRSDLLPCHQSLVISAEFQV